MGGFANAYLRGLAFQDQRAAVVQPAQLREQHLLESRQRLAGQAATRERHAQSRSLLPLALGAPARRSPTRCSSRHDA